MEFEDMLDMLYEISNKDFLTDDELSLLVTASNEKSSEARYIVAETLILSNSEVSKNTLIKLSKDADYLVRASACESLGIFNDEIVLDVLKNIILKDKSVIVRCYALISLSDILCNLDDSIKRKFKTFVLELLAKTVSNRLKITCYRALYFLDENKYLSLILRQLNNSSYQERCFVVNILMDVSNEKNAIQVINALLERNKIEKTQAVLSSMDRAIRHLKKMSEK